MGLFFGFFVGAVTGTYYWKKDFIMRLMHVFQEEEERKRNGYSTPSPRRDRESEER